MKKSILSKKQVNWPAKELIKGKYRYKIEYQKKGRHPYKREKEENIYDRLNEELFEEDC